MVTRKTESEVLFEAFCNRHRLDWATVETGPTKTPDYRLKFGSATVVVEIKQIESEDGFETNGVSSRTVGDHVRRKIAEARKQLQAVSRIGTPTILLVYNSVDPMQLFGTETRDFVCAMYGELTVRLKEGRLEDSFYGRNSSLRSNMNTSFSAVGHLRRCAGGSDVRIFENIYARHPLPFDKLSPYIEVVRVEVENAA